MSLLLKPILALGVVAVPLTVLAQTPSSVTAVPVPPVNLTYQYVPDYFVEWLPATDQPYSTIEAYMEGSADKPAIDITLTDRATAARVHYVNTPELVTRLTHQGAQVHLTNISYKAPENTPDGARTWAFGLRDTTGKVVLWRFQQGSDLSEAGQGVTPRAADPGLRLEYRENGAVAGDGSLVEVGSSVNKAEVWKEHSTPPYFIAYHGAHCHGVVVLDLLPGTETWTAQGTPAAGWQLSSSTGETGTLKQSTSGPNGGTFLLSPTTPGDAPMLLKTGPDDRIQSLEIGDKQHAATILFSQNTASGPASFTVVVHKKKIAEGATQSAAASGPLTLSVNTPAWAAGRQITQTRETAPGPSTASTTPAQPSSPTAPTSPTSQTSPTSPTASITKPVTP